MVTGHRGMVGSSLLRQLGVEGYEHLITASHDELDLCDMNRSHQWVAETKPDVVIVAAGKVGGIHANDTYPADFLYENLMIACNMVEASFRAGVKRLLFLGSSCIYPKEAPQPIREESILSSPLEKTNEGYAIAKIAGLKLCEYYRRQHGVIYHSAMPCNLYGPGDNYHSENSHVIPALLRRFHEAKVAGDPSVTIWGSGKPLREFLHVDDLAAGCLRLLGEENPPDLVNIGAGEEISIAELAKKVAAAVGYQGEIFNDTSKPDGTMRKIMDNSRIRSLGWKPAIAFEQGLQLAYADFCQQLEAGALRSK